MTTIDSTKKYSDDEFKAKLAKMLKDRDISIKDVPKHLRDEVAKLAWGKYPLKNFGDLEIIYK